MESPPKAVTDAIMRMTSIGFASVLATAGRPALAQDAASALPQFPEAAAMTTAGAPLSARQNQQMVSIPARIYTIGSPANHALQTSVAQPEHRVELRAFRIDRSEVTNAQFSEFLNHLPVRPSGTAQGGSVGEANIPAPFRSVLLEGARPIIELDDSDARIGVGAGRFMPTAGYEDHPVTEVTWAGAYTYCRWRGARLPTEVEWEAAARGREARPFPWGAALPTSEHVVVRQGAATTARVGSRPQGATPEGVLDMAGSLSEWTSSLDRPYPYRADDGRESTAAAGERVVRGGDATFNNTPDKLVSWNRSIRSRNPAAGHHHIGFRCAADLPQTSGTRPTS